MLFKSPKTNDVDARSVSGAGGALLPVAPTA
jgi:hypothetical protein